MTYSLSWYIPTVAGILMLLTGPVDRDTFHSSPLPFFAQLCILLSKSISDFVEKILTYNYYPMEIVVSIN